ncbi:PDR/VanB family oxidoreductase [Cryobacterium sp. TMS1-13-1]|uniref:PDR/VanB family oxidoreductase n=1 Tax=Cryobacterium sp. TMS1-13-1 TaxID=1259220 RepID=UPI00106C2330|nr:PDR/VanB family oxidoreductase [Cryobacterium sp. TMS1-13-1]TFD19556.1 oxidoreductase [Cryobacterium sp. TMS1-13-1]
MAATNIEVWQQATVIETEAIATNIQRIVLAPTLPKRAEPGSHLDLFVTIDGERHKRSYSVVESTEDGSRVAISVLQAPLSRGGSIFMHALQLGDTLEITQPLQNFPLRVGAPGYVLLAGGIGVTAIVNMARVLKNLGANYTLVYAARSRERMAYLPELLALHGDNLRVHIDDEGTELSVTELVGSVDPQAELYMCGPIRLMDAVRRAWRERELNLPNLRFETFGNSGWYDPEEFIVRVPRLGVEARVPAGRSMLEALEAVGVEMMFDCRKGECGLCEVKVLALEGAIDHRDVFYSERQQHAAEKMSCCVSRAVTSPTGLHADAARSGPAIVTIAVS